MGHFPLWPSPPHMPTATLLSHFLQQESIVCASAPCLPLLSPPLGSSLPGCSGLGQAKCWRGVAVMGQGAFQLSIECRVSLWLREKWFRAKQWRERAPSCPSPHPRCWTAVGWLKLARVPCCLLSLRVTCPYLQSPRDIRGLLRVLHWPSSYCLSSPGLSLASYCPFCHQNLGLWPPTLEVQLDGCFLD